MEKRKKSPLIGNNEIKARSIAYVELKFELNARQGCVVVSIGANTGDYFVSWLISPCATPIYALMIIQTSEENNNSETDD